MKERILVVDDEKDVREFMMNFLTDHGYSVDYAIDGNQGLEKLQATKPDLILLDIQMPNETGVGFYRKMYMNKEIENIPVIIISGMPGSNMSLNERIPIIDKPIDTDRLLKQIEVMLD